MWTFLDQMSMDAIYNYYQKEFLDFVLEKLTLAWV